MRLFFLSTKFHFTTHWSSKTHFWSGVIGMLVNNSLTLLGIWAMLFAGKESGGARDSFFVMNFVLMFAWGIIHALLGGVSNLDTQISEGGLDLAMASPRSPFYVLSLTSSHLPAWGDVILGLVGLIAFSIPLGPLFLLQALLISAFATLALFGFFLFVGSLAFWFRRTEAAHSVLINLCLAFNTYPITAGGGANARWVIFVAPLFLVGAIPAHYLLAPSWRLLGAEAAGSVLLFFCTRAFFYLGMRRYQSTSVLGLQRT